MSPGREPTEGRIPTNPETARQPLVRYLREELLPTTFCPGCGGGTVLNAFTRAIEGLGIDPRQELALVTGIGCSSWIPSPYLRADTLHTTHGRAIAFATGVKIAQPRRKVVVIAGDGDLAGIGGNHLIHAARRNIGLKVILVNNFIYGMTGGQVAPTTPVGTTTTTTPHGNLEYPFRIAELVTAAGANLVSRWTTFHVFQLVKAIKTCLEKDGFSLIEVLSQCPTSYGKSTRMRTAAAMLELFKERSVTVSRAAEMDEAALADRFVVGKLVEREREELTAALARQRVSARKQAGLD